jgi:hypothetical protein
MANDNPLKWKLKLMAELVPGECVEYDVTEWERGEEVTLGSLGRKPVTRTRSRSQADASGLPIARTATAARLQLR